MRCTPKDSLAEDAGVALWDGEGFRGIVLAPNLDTAEDVNEAFELALKGGGSALKAPRQKTWGGYSGYIADPDGHAWEIAYNPSWPIGADGRPGYRVT